MQDAMLVRVVHCARQFAMSPAAVRAEMACARRLHRVVRLRLVPC